MNFSTAHVNKPAEYWKDVLFCETKIMMYNNGNPNIGKTKYSSTITEYYTNNIVWQGFCYDLACDSHKALPLALKLM